MVGSQYIRLINLKRNLFDLAGKKTPTGQTALEKRVVSSKSNFNYFPHPDAIVVAADLFL